MASVCARLSEPEVCLEKLSEAWLGRTERTPVCAAPTRFQLALTFQLPLTHGRIAASIFRSVLMCVHGLHTAAKTPGDDQLSPLPLKQMVVSLVKHELMLAWPHEQKLVAAVLLSAFWLQPVGHSCADLVQYYQSHQAARDKCRESVGEPHHFSCARQFFRCAR